MPAPFACRYRIHKLIVYDDFMTLKCFPRLRSLKKEIVQGEKESEVRLQKKMELEEKYADKPKRIGKEKYPFEKRNHDAFGFPVAFPAPVDSRP